MNGIVLDPEVLEKECYKCEWGVVPEFLMQATSFCKVSCHFFSYKIYRSWKTRDGTGRVSFPRFSSREILGMNQSRVRNKAACLPDRRK